MGCAGCMGRGLPTKNMYTVLLLRLKVEMVGGGTVETKGVIIITLLYLRKRPHRGLPDIRCSSRNGGATFYNLTYAN